MGIVSGELTKSLAEDMAFLELDLITVKGKTIPERIFALLGDETLASTSEYRTLAQSHHGMLSAYRGQNWEEAARLIDAAENAAASAGLDLSRLYALFRDRVSGFRADPPPPDWDGVFVATTKG